MAANHNPNAKLVRKAPKRHALYLSVFLLYVTLSPQAVGKEFNVQIMPKQLIAEAQNHGCEQVENFYSVVAAYGPPFVYGFVRGGDPARYYGLNSAAFWCRKKSSTNRYLLIAVVDEELRNEFKCPAVVIEIRDYIGALSVRDETWELDAFREVDSGRTAGTGVYQAAALVSGTEAYEDIFLCYKGRWLRQERD